MFASLLIDLANVTRDTIDRRIFGCHHDPGFTQASRGFHANLVMGASPTLCSSCEANPYKVPLWSPRPSAAAAKIDTGCAFATKPSLRLTAIAGSGAAAVANRGLGSAGFVLEAHKPYEFSAFIYLSRLDHEHDAGTGAGAHHPGDAAARGPRLVCDVGADQRDPRTDGRHHM
eukprot:CAMPEP_0181255538 /NCGR_PEP_ID=MMETSP1096-20121128/49207_1 /TAXON_ID=156174 ORGANISM="Chrysochromulina ericina, Strain CCMP281" /NCGR_SAMPLE_ID=MMETSP1096 /ASSEMBLY_ACC=CAM_ASM_000453 /LENGTH=172 /DNA_ID=CAMNT_0023353681 /DNA_START=327 /DNA_END=846 /DNA_ORIENTATION=-